MTDLDALDDLPFSVPQSLEPMDQPPAVPVDEEVPEWML